MKHKQNIQHTYTFSLDEIREWCSSQARRAYGEARVAQVQPKVSTIWDPDDEVMNVTISEEENGKC